ncbi:hypothetical protein CK215_01095 [Mesorhizobium sp. WSM3864]|nr:hypothetical protein CK215_01095 [Mesorhizobium sp. WSM3864]
MGTIPFKMARFELFRTVFAIFSLAPMPSEPLLGLNWWSMTMAKMRAVKVYMYSSRIRCCAVNLNWF